MGDRHTMYGWGYKYDIVSGVDHSGFKSGQTTNDDNMRQHQDTDIGVILECSKISG
jgi:hypothetical protein